MLGKTHKTKVIPITIINGNKSKFYGDVPKYEINTKYIERIMEYNYEK